MQNNDEEAGIRLHCFYKSGPVYLKKQPRAPAALAQSAQSLRCDNGFLRVMSLNRPARIYPVLWDRWAIIQRIESRGMISMLETSVQ